MTLITVPGAVDMYGDSKIEEEGHHVPWNSAPPDLRVSCGMIHTLAMAKKLKYLR